MRVLMLGWEFPPNKSGGLGTACYGITQALLKKGTDVLFVLPKSEYTEHPVSHVKLRSADGTLIPDVRASEPAVRDAVDNSTGLPDLKRAVYHDMPVQPAAGSAANARLDPNCEVPRPAPGASAEELHKYAATMVIRGIRSALRPYDTPQTYEERITREIAEKVLRENPEFNVPESMSDFENLGKILAAAGPAPEELNEAFAAASEELKQPSAGRPAPTTQTVWNRVSLKGGYGPDLMSEVWRFSIAAAEIALHEDFDVVHVHDWMTYPAGILIKQLTGKPLVAHIHALEHDRSGEGVNHEIAHIEWAGMTAADKVVAVSWYTKNEVMRQYLIPSDKIEVVHNAVNRNETQSVYHLNIPPHKEKRVLFMSRITYQKGPDYFVEAARLVHERMPNVHFVMAGSGDMFYRMVRRVAELRMGDVFHFAGFQTGPNVERMYASCDLYVMPSVSEPFGIAPLEAMICDSPVIISNQSGVAEVVRNALKVDFWDVQEMANKICAVLSYPKLAAAMVKNSHEDLRRIRWSTAANRLNAIYREVLDRR